MPIYEYECKECLHRFEEWAKMEDPFPVCPECKGEVERIISLTGVGKVEMNSRELLEKVIKPDAKKIAAKIRSGDQEAAADLFGEG